MCRKLILLVCLVAVLGLVDSAFGFARWRNLEGDQDFSRPANWFDTSSLYTGRMVLNRGPAHPNYPTDPPVMSYTPDPCYTPNVIRGPGYNSGSPPFYWYITGGFMRVTGPWSICHNVNTTGYTEMTGGELVFEGNILCPRSDDSTATVDLHGGTIRAEGIEFKAGGLFDFGGHGTLILDGDVTADVVTWIGTGYMTAYGGSGEVVYDYDQTNPGKTTISTIAWPVAEEPNPAYWARGACPTALQLSWKTGPETQDPNGHDVYFSTDYDAVKNANRDSDPYGVLVFEGYDSNTYPESGGLALDFGTTYYWRIDEVNDNNTASPWKGNVWRFTTEDGNASDPDPPDGRRGVNPADVVLRWTPSCIATVNQVVYFSTDFDDVNIMNPTAIEDTVSATDNNCPVGALEKYTSYYWRIKTDTGGNGEVWSFRTGYGGLLLEMLFDGGTPGNDILSPLTDTSGNNLQFTKYTNGGSLKYAEPRFAPVGGTSADFDPNVGLYRLDPCDANGWDYLRLDGYQYTIQLWVKPEVLPDGGRPRVVHKSQSSWAIEIDNGDRQVVFRHANNTLGMPDDFMRAGEWHHLTAIYDATASAEELRIYVDGILFDNTEDAGSPNPADNTERVTIGYRQLDDVNVGDFFDGLIDELKIWDMVVLPVLECSIDPSPSVGADRLDPNLVLSWTPGPFAGQHDVYLGSDPNNIVHVGTVDGNTYPADSNLLLEFGKTYYWRVDDVNGGDTYEGVVWRFSTTSPIEDPNMWLWYKFDDTSDNEPIDSSGHYFHGDGDDFDDDTWDPNDGRFPGCINMDSDQRIDIPLEAFVGKIHKEASVSVWVKGASRPGSNNWLFGIG
ncbi:MAG: LamG domain-containing protein, partial [Planctomycetota bacterium]